MNVLQKCIVQRNGEITQLAEMICMEARHILCLQYEAKTITFKEEYENKWGDVITENRRILKKAQDEYNAQRKALVGESLMFSFPVRFQ